MVRFIVVIVILGSLNMNAVAINKTVDAGPGIILQQSPGSDSTKTDKKEEKSIKILNTDEDSSNKSSKMIDDEDTDSSKSIVSFNFIYYLIQKFKFSDLLGR